MAKQTINIGTTANDGTGDPLRNAFDKINDNFDELYAVSPFSGDYNDLSNKPTTMQSRSSIAGTTSSIANNASATLNVTGFKSYALLSIQTDRAAWVRLYSTDAARTADSSRTQGVDPSPNAGVIAEAITSGAATVLFTPAALGFNAESTPTTTIPVAITNLSGSTSTVTVTLKILQLEA